MRSVYFQSARRWFRQILTISGLILAPMSVYAESVHGLAMYGDPALPAEFSALPYANPDAPTGGSIVLGNTGGFDSLNPFIAKGTVPWQLSTFTHESLMGRSLDEPFTLYGLLAESIEVPPDRAWIEFTLRPEAAFSDGSPVTVADVLWSFESLGTNGHPKYRGLWSKISDMRQTSPRSLRITFNENNRELALLVGMRPILKAAQWQDRDIAQASLEDVPIGSGPYRVAHYQAGRSVTLARNPSYWAKDLPLRKGTHSLDEIRLEFFANATALSEAFKAGYVSSVREFNADRWANRYDFPRALNGEVVKTEIPHQKPSGMTGFVINSRRAPFDDWRVRAALIQAFNFEYINETMTGGAQPRITSYFSNSKLAMRPGPAQGRTADLLAPFADTLPPGALTGYDLPQSNGRARNRKGIRAALDLLAQAGWTPREGVMSNAKGAPLNLTILLAQNSSENKAIAELYLDALSRLGITATIEITDSAQYVQRTTTFDFDLTYFRRSLSLSPGNEQRFYWGSAAADQDGSRNLMGAKSPAVDAMIDAMLSAESNDDFVAATRALDRALMAGRYVIPFWQFTTGRIAHDRHLKFPATIPIYGDGARYFPEMWWWDAR